MARSVAGCAVIGLVMAAVFFGTELPRTRLIGKIDFWDASAVAANSIDLSKKLFVKGELCPHDGLLSLYSEADSQGCLVADSKTPVTLVATGLNNLNARVFRVDMETPEGTVDGWVTADQLRN